MGNPTVTIYGDSNANFRPFQLKPAVWNDTSQHTIEVSDITVQGTQFEVALALGSNQGVIMNFDNGAYSMVKYIEDDTTLSTYNNVYYKIIYGSSLLANVFMASTRDLNWFGLAVQVTGETIYKARVIWQVTSGTIYVSTLLGSDVITLLNAHAQIEQALESYEHSVTVLSNNTTFKFSRSQWYNVEDMLYTDDGYYSPMSVPAPVEDVTYDHTTVGYDGGYPYKSASAELNQNVYPALKHTLNFLGADILRVGSDDTFPDIPTNAASNDRTPENYEITLSTNAKMKLRLNHLNYNYYWDFYDSDGNLLASSPGFDTELNFNTTYRNSWTDMWISKNDDGTLTIFGCYRKLGVNYCIVNFYTLPANLTAEWLEGVELITESEDGYLEDESAAKYGDGESGKDKGVFHPESDDIDDIDIPSDNIIDCGALGVWNPTTVEMAAMITELQNTTFVDKIKSYFETPLDGILSLHIVPCTVSTSDRDHPFFGNTEFDVNMNKVSEQYYTVNLGSISVKEWWGNFLDYAPNTSIQIFLPFIGVKDLDVDVVMNEAINLKYIIDCITGACVACLYVGGQLRYQWGGNCIREIPVTSRSYSNLLSSTVSAVTSVGATVAGYMTGNIGGAFLGLGLASASAGAMQATKPHVGISGGFVGSSGWLSSKQAYIFRKQPYQSCPKNYTHYKGKPSNITLAVSQCTGFTVYDSVDVDNITALEEEKAMIESILKGGFYA